MAIELKGFRFAFYLSVLFLVFVYGLRASNPLKETPIAYWTMNEISGDIVMDMSGNDHNGTAVETLIKDGVVGNCRYFYNDINNTIKSYIDFGQNSEFNLEPPFTISMWVLHAHDSQTLGYLISNSGDGAGYYCIKDANHRIEFGLRGSAGSFSITSSTSLIKNNWYHVVCIAHSETNLEIYINNVSEVSGSITGGYNYQSTYPLLITSNPENPDTRGLNGQMDEVAIYNSALTPEEISSLYNLTGDIYIQGFQNCLADEILDTGLAIPIRYSCQYPTAGIQLPIIWQGAPLILDTVIFENTAMETWSGAYSVDTANQTLLLGYADTDGDVILSGEDTVLAWLYFEMDCDPAMAHDSIILAFDTATVGEDGLLFADNSYPSIGFVPNVVFDTTVVQTYRPGDVNADCTINILDAVDFIGYKFKGQAHPPCRDNAMDVNGDCTINILDVIYLIDYKFKGGSAPVCGCAEEGAPAAFKGNPDGDLIANSIRGETSILFSTYNNLRGLEMTLKVLDGSTVEVTGKPDNFEVYYSQERDIVTLGLLDFEGDAVIDSKTETLLTFDGPVEIIDAIGADENTAPVYFNIVNKGEAGSTLPTTYALHQNYPNPFNPETQISFALPERADIRLEIYNIMGQKVATAAEGSFEAGIHTVTWDGSQSASGVYFYKLTAGDFEQTRKMLLLK